MEISVVIPVYKTKRFITSLHERLSHTLSQLTQNYQIIYVDDASPDFAWDTLKHLAETDDHVVALRLASNFGQHAAIAAGVSVASGRWTAVLDSDLQDPPEGLRYLYKEAQAGAEIILAKRQLRQDGLLRRIYRALYFTLSRIVTGQNIDAGYGTLSMFSMRARDKYNASSERKWSYLQILASTGLPLKSIQYKKKRMGKSPYQMRKLLRLAINKLVKPSRNSPIFVITEKIAQERTDRILLRNS